MPKVNRAFSARGFGFSAPWAGQARHSCARRTLERPSGSTIKRGESDSFIRISSFHLIRVHSRLLVVNG